MFEKLKDTLDKQIYEKLINNQVLSEEEIIIVATELIDIKCINEALLFINENKDRISKRYYPSRNTTITRLSFWIRFFRSLRRKTSRVSSSSFRCAGSGTTS